MKSSTVISFGDDLLKLNASLLSCAGEAILAAALVSTLVKAYLEVLTLEYLNLVNDKPTTRGGDNSCLGEPVDAEGDGDDDEDDDDPEDGEEEDLSSEEPGDLGNGQKNKDIPKKGPGGESGRGGAEENGEDEDDGPDEEDGDDDDEEEEDDDEDDDDDDDGGDEEEDVVEEEEEEEEEEEDEEALQPPKKRKK